MHTNDMSISSLMISWRAKIVQAYNVLTLDHLSSPIIMPRPIVVLIPAGIGSACISIRVFEIQSILSLTSVDARTTGKSTGALVC